MRRVIAFVLLAFALGACSKKPEETVPAPAQPAAPPAPTAAVSAAPTAPADSADIPTEEDFEAEAERRITSKNLEAELDKLEKEIAE